MIFDRSSGPSATITYALSLLSARQADRVMRSPTDPPNALEYFASSPTGAATALAVGIASLVASIFLYYRSRRTHAIHFQLARHVVARRNSAISDRLQVQFDGSPVEQLTLVRLGLWNRGPLPMRRDDIAPADPLRLDFPAGASVLAATLTFESALGVSGEVALNDSRDSVLLTFHHLAPRQGFVVEILHNQRTDLQPRIAGTIVGAANSRRLDPDLPVLDGLIGGVLDRYPKLDPTWPTQKRLGWWLVFPILVILLLLVAFACMPMELLRKLFPGVPRSLQVEKSGFSQDEPT